jgi:hypothetical protein
MIYSFPRLENFAEPPAAVFIHRVKLGFAGVLINNDVLYLLGTRASRVGAPIAVLKSVLGLVLHENSELGPDSDSSNGSGHVVESFRLKFFLGGEI